MFEGVIDVLTDEGQKYELHYGGEVRRFDTKQQATDELLLRLQSGGGAANAAPATTRNPAADAEERPAVEPTS
jgi:hypothetical protein